MKAAHHVLFLQATTKFGGSKRSLLGLIEVLRGSRFQPVVAYGKPGWLMGELDRLQVPHVQLPFLAWRKWLERFRVRSSIHKRWVPALSHWPIALVHSNEFWSAPHAVILGKALKVPSVVHLRDGHHTLSKARQYRLPECQAILGVSTELREQFAADRNLYEKTVVLFNGHDSCPSARASRLPTRKKLSFGPDEFVLGNVGRLCPRKNQLALLPVLAALRGKHPRQRWRLALAGDAEPAYHAMLQAAAKAYGLEQAISVLGPVANISDFYGAIDVLVQTAQREGLSRVIPEAMLCRCPVVATAAEGVRDCLPDDSFGLVTEPGNAAALTEAIVALAEDEARRETMVEQAFQRAQRLFTHAVLRTRLLNIYDALVSGKPVTP